MRVFENLPKLMHSGDLDVIWWFWFKTDEVPSSKRWMVEMLWLSKAWKCLNRTLPWKSIEVAADENGVTVEKQSSKWLPRRCWMMKQASKFVLLWKFEQKNAKCKMNVFERKWFSVCNWWLLGLENGRKYVFILLF